MKIAATISVPYQVSIDQWRDHNETRVFEDIATIKQIMDWANTKLSGKAAFSDIQLSTVDES